MTGDLGIPRCYWCGALIAVQDSGEWGHIALTSERTMRFWCFGHKRVVPSLADGSVSS